MPWVSRLPTHIDRILGARRLHPGEAQVAADRPRPRRASGPPRPAGIDHALLEQRRRAARHVDLVVQALGIDEPVRGGAGGHGRDQVPVAVLDLRGRRVREDGHGAAGLIGLRAGPGTA